MPIEITLHHTVFLPFTVRVPDACPRCSADFTNGSNLREWDAAEVQFAGRIDARPNAAAAFEVVDELDRGDVFRPVAFYCQGCGASIHEAKSVLVDATRIRRRIAKALDLRPR
jgi:hypothetical protein